MLLIVSSQNALTTNGYAHLKCKSVSSITVSKKWIKPEDKSSVDIIVIYLVILYITEGHYCVNQCININYEISCYRR